MKWLQRFVVPWDDDPSVDNLSKELAELHLFSLVGNTEHSREEEVRIALANVAWKENDFWNLDEKK